MANDYEDLSADAAELLLDSHRETATLRRAGASAAPVQATVLSPGSQFEDSPDGVVSLRRLEAQFPATVAELGTGDVLILEDGSEWGLEQDHGAEGGIRWATFVRSEPVDKTRSGRRTRGAP